MKKVELLVVFALFFLLCIPAYPQGEPPTSESTMNLSYPANFYVTPLQTGTIGTYTLSGAYPTAMSYGCEVPELIGTTTYPNTSCVVATGTGFTAQSYDECLARCTTLGTTTIERIYWQKDPVNKWQAGYNVSSTPLPVNYIDWGDNLEGKTWPVQVIRVETNTFSWLPLASDSRTRMDMWHVFGQGTNELWGLHASHTDPPKGYVYLDSATTVNWPFAVNVTATARLNITKLESTSSSCPISGTGVSQSPYTPEWIFNPTTGTGKWGTPVFQVDELYGAELNIKGSYVYGYNWNLRSMNTGTLPKPGWWRLTFYTSDNSIDFGAWLPYSTELGDTLAPPIDLTTTPVADAGDVAALVDAKAEEGGDTGLPLYVPIVDKTNNLTYIDVCIKAGNAGGGGGKKGPR